MCVGGDIMDKTISEAAQILQRISNGTKNATRLAKMLSIGAKRQKQAQGAC
jgi:F0F1-type ATP synthase gamma subunit